MGEDRQQAIIKLEEDAEKLVQNIAVLYEQAGSYKTAKEELEKINTHLLSLINETQALSKESHRIIEETNKIGSLKILTELEAVKNEEVNILSRLDIVENNQGNIDKKLDAIEKKNKMFYLIFIVGLSIIGILQIINLVIK